MSLAVYVAVNHRVFGTFLPISGMVKSTFPHLAINPASFAMWLHLLGGRGLLAVMICAAIMVWAAAATFFPRLRLGVVDGDLVLVFMLSGVVVMHSAYSCLFTRNVWPWYHDPYLLVAALGIILIASRFAHSRPAASPRLAQVAVVALAVVCFVLPFREVVKIAEGRKDTTWMPYSYDAAIWARSHSTPDTVFAFTDCGIFGYFSQRRVG